MSGKAVEHEGKTQAQPQLSEVGLPWASRLLIFPLLLLLRLYQWVLSPLLGPACRFHPSCSHYARQSLQTHGAILGLWYALRRLCRCHPFCAGGFDPVPPRRSGPGKVLR